MKDDILAELWAVKDQMAAKYKGNVKRFMNDLQKAEAKSSLRKASPRKVMQSPRRKSA